MISKKHLLKFEISLHDPGGMDFSRGRTYVIWSYFSVNVFKDLHPLLLCIIEY